MRIGLSTPVVIQLPRAHGRWEEGAGIEEIRQVAEAADRLGYDYLTCSEHVAVPVEVAAVRGGTYWDPVATLGYLAARTRRIRLATSVVVLGYHHPLALAKTYGTVDRISGGRLILGVGVGTLAEEFALLGAPFADRGARADDAIAALRACLSATRPRYHGPFYDIEGFHVEPCALSERVPIWVGGRSARSLRRAATLGDGWMPFGLDRPTLASLLARHELPSTFDVVFPATRALDPSGAAEYAAADLADAEAHGANAVTVTLRASSLAHYLDQLAALAELVGLDAAGPS